MTAGRLKVGDFLFYFVIIYFDGYFILLLLIELTCTKSKKKNINEINVKKCKA